MRDRSIARAVAHGGDVESANKLVGRYDLRWRLWEGPEEVATRCRCVGASVFLEWPKHCRYGSKPNVFEFTHRLGFDEA
eukprot:679124-Alexandrium_andersonii.AAC.1